MCANPVLSIFDFEEKDESYYEISVREEIVRGWLPRRVRFGLEYKCVCCFWCDARIADFEDFEEKFDRVINFKRYMMNLVELENGVVYIDGKPLQPIDIEPAHLIEEAIYLSDERSD